MDTRSLCPTWASCEDTIVTRPHPVLGAPSPHSGRQALVKLRTKDMHPCSLAGFSVSGGLSLSRGTASGAVTLPRTDAGRAAQPECHHPCAPRSRGPCPPGLSQGPTAMSAPSPACPPAPTWQAGGLLTIGVPSPGIGSAQRPDVPPGLTGQRGDGTAPQRRPATP